METLLLSTDELDIAAKILRENGLVVCPTETVYALACNATLDICVGKIFDIKGRNENNPMSLMIASPGDVDRYCEDIPYAARHLMKRFWPGPLTIILKSKDTVSSVLRAGGDTIGVRCPDCEVARELMQLSYLPLCATSANPSGENPAQSAEEAMAYFDGKVGAVIDGGVSNIKIPSTVVDMSSAPYNILREGAIATETVMDALRESLILIGITGTSGSGKTTALKTLHAMGACLVDADEVYHGLLHNSEPMLEELSQRFPDAVEDGKLNRKALGSVVFNSPEALKDLNTITHKYVSERVNGILSSWARTGGRIAAVDAIALLESDIGSRCSVTVGVTAPPETRLERIMARDGISREQAQSRIDAQKQNSYFSENCDYTLENNGTEEEFLEKCRQLFTKIIEQQEDMQNG